MILTAPAIYPHTKTGPKEKGHKIWEEQPCKSPRAPAFGGFLALFGPWQGEGPVFWRCCGGGAGGGGPVPEEGWHLLAGGGWSPLKKGSQKGVSLSYTNIPIDVDVTVDLLRVGKLDVWWVWRGLRRGRGSRVPLVKSIVIFCFTTFHMLSGLNLQRREVIRALFPLSKICQAQKGVATASLRINIQRWKNWKPDKF